MCKLPVIHAYSYQRKVETSQQSKWNFTERVGRTVQYAFSSMRCTKVSRYKKYLPLIKKQIAEIETLDDSTLHDQIKQLRIELRKHKKIPRILIARTAALIREVSGRKLGLYHYDSQLVGGLALLHCNVIEMQTGEGKTLTALLPAISAALMGVPVFVLTVNDYLTQRDADEMRVVYESFGLTLGCVTHKHEIEEKRQAYAADVTYCTASELVFDYLKDQTSFLGKDYKLAACSRQLTGKNQDKRLIRSLNFAIIDEVDSILLDEARTPLILSGNEVADSGQEKIYSDALDIASQLENHVDFTLFDAEKRLELTASGYANISKASKGKGEFWENSKRGNTLIKKALYAIYLLKKDQDYLVVDGKVQIVDSNTGRLMADRNWQRGLQQLVELKEKCDLTHPHETLAQITYQTFFQYFDNLAGMSGTVIEAKSELGIMYHMPAVVVPPHRQSLRKSEGVTHFENNEEKYAYIVKKAREISARGRSVLIGTLSVRTSERLHEYFIEQGVKHNVLNARQDKEEAEIISQAGKEGVITIATSMAGRGTDIKLSQACKSAGGLHVIVSEYHHSRRLDRQLIGRSARQGDPGGFEFLFSHEDMIVRHFNRLRRLTYTFSRTVLSKYIAQVQSSIDKKDRKLRYKLLKVTPYDDMLTSLGRKGF